MAEMNRTSEKSGANLPATPGTPTPAGRAPFIGVRPTTDTVGQAEANGTAGAEAWFSADWKQTWKGNRDAFKEQVAAEIEVLATSQHISAGEEHLFEEQFASSIQTMRASLVKLLFAGHEIEVHLAEAVALSTASQEQLSQALAANETLTRELGEFSRMFATAIRAGEPGGFTPAEAFGRALWHSFQSKLDKSALPCMLVTDRNYYLSPAPMLAAALGRKLTAWDNKTLIDLSQQDAQPLIEGCLDQGQPGFAILRPTGERPPVRYSIVPLSALKIAGMDARTGYHCLLIATPVNITQERRWALANTSINTVFFTLLTSIANAVEGKDPITGFHTARVYASTHLLGRLSQQFYKALDQANPLPQRRSELERLATELAVDAATYAFFSAIIPNAKGVPPNPNFDVGSLAAYLTAISGEQVSQEKAALLLPHVAKRIATYIKVDAGLDSGSPQVQISLKEEISARELLPGDELSPTAIEAIAAHEVQGRIEEVCSLLATSINEFVTAQVAIEIDMQLGMTFGAANDAMAQTAGLYTDEGTRRMLRLAALLHDIGKLGIPDSVLGKTGIFTEREFQTIRLHPLLAFQILYPLLHEGLPMLAIAALFHHERGTGEGYPFGLKENAIPFAAQLVGVADVFDAMTSVRPYKPGMEPQTVIGRMMAEEAHSYSSFALGLAGIAWRTLWLEGIRMTHESSAEDVNTIPVAGLLEAAGLEDKPELRKTFFQKYSDVAILLDAEGNRITDEADYGQVTTMNLTGAIAAARRVVNHELVVAILQAYDKAARGWPEISPADFAQRVVSGDIQLFEQRT
ncbi:hypothetical protein COT30_01525 [Candidatus Micrarchaeota archaeon CG08_land_8_20_14_0_20_49_17]|nr:MAG: hypothetical protein COT30_01525 [Candidatus Micrarchaeota archaeon CG08_land_8_20_14_0_20_49_17]HII53855.1 HD domain-containing protein [Candidatus Micrarchaeota archaeon]